MNLKTIVLIIIAIFPFTNAKAISTKYTGSCSSLAKESGKYPEKKVKGYPSESIFKKMTQANQLMSQGDKSQALALINEVKNSTKDSFTLSVVYQYLARDAYERNRFSQAVDYAQKVVDLDALPVNAILGMKKQVAWSYLGKKDYKNAIAWMRQYFDQVINPPVSDYKALAQLYYQDSNYRGAICPAFIALKKTTKKKDKESLYKMLFGMHYSLKDMAGSANILSEMINVFPNEKKYWEQLFSIEYQRGKQDNALAVSELAYKKGLWTTEKEFKNLASMHANSGSPLIAAKVLENGFNKGIVSKSLDNLKLVARYWEQSRERKKAIEAYSRVANADSSGKYYYRIGNIYFEQENYKKAIENFSKAVRKGNMKQSESGYSYLQKGASEFYLGNETAAIASIEKAKAYQPTVRQAVSWLGFIREKQRVRAALKRDAEQLEAEVAAEKAEAEAKKNN